MNTQKWIHHFQRNTRLNDCLQLPPGPCGLPDPVRRALAASLAIFQLGETGGGTRLRRYARQVAPSEQFKGYQQAVDLFVAEELSHSRLLARVVGHLDGQLIEKQWTNSVFRGMRGLINLEFAIQVLLTAELIAEVYYGMLFLRCADPVVKEASRKILRDEMKHLEFQREFLAERIAAFSPAGRWLWRMQFRLIHRITTAVVAWDHRACLGALAVSQSEFRHRAAAAWGRFQQRLETKADEARMPEPKGEISAAAPEARRQTALFSEPTP